MIWTVRMPLRVSISAFSRADMGSSIEKSSFASFSYSAFIAVSGSLTFTGANPVTFFDDAVRVVLERTLGVPLFQEQAMALAVVAAGFTPGEADQLRRAIGAWKTRGNQIERFGDRLIEGMLARGYPRAFAERSFEQIKGFSGYGFPESHAASFALIVYASSWLKRHHPAAFAAALLNSQPMGFYQPAQIVRDAKEHGVEVRPIDANHSDWDCTLEPGESSPALRLGLRLVNGLRRDEADRVSECVRRRGAFRSIAALWRATGTSAASMRRLAQADAFGSMGLSRQRALWAVQSLRDERLPLFDAEWDDDGAPSLRLPPRSPASEVHADYASAGLSLKAHPVSFIRGALRARGAAPNEALSDGAAMPRGARATVAGVVLVRQRPGTASGIVFMTIEDETGVANLIVKPRVYERYRSAARHSRIVLCRGVVERQGEVVHVLARELRSLDRLAAGLMSVSRDFH